MFLQLKAMPFAHIQWKKEEYEKILPIIQELHCALPALPNISPTQRALMDHYDSVERRRLESLLEAALHQPELLSTHFDLQIATSDIETYMRLSQLRNQIELCRDQIETLLTGKLAHNKVYADVVDENIYRQQKLELHKLPFSALKNRSGK